MKYLSELRVYYKPKKNIFERYIDSLMAGDIKNLTIKEEWIMLEKLTLQREEYAAELERLRNADLDAVVNARFELVKAKITEEAIAEHNEKLAEAARNVEHYDFVIEKLSAVAETEDNSIEAAAEDVSNDVSNEEINETPEYTNVVDCENIVEG